MESRLLDTLKQLEFKVYRMKLLVKYRRIFSRMTREQLAAESTTYVLTTTEIYTQQVEMNKQGITLYARHVSHEVDTADILPLADK